MPTLGRREEYVMSIRNLFYIQGKNQFLGTQCLALFRSREKSEYVADHQ